MLIIHIRWRQAGMTMIEIMIALAVNTVLLIGLVSIFAQNVNHQRKSLELMRLNQQMHNAMDIMSGEIRRAGYWLNAKSDIGTSSNNNPFMAAATDISINAGGNCILFTYDHDKNGSLPAVSSSIDDERYGYRLQGTAIQARPPGASFACNAAANAWENITDVNLISISALTFTMTTKTIVTGPGTIGIKLRSVDISMTGSLVGDSSVTATLTQHVRIRNDKYIP